MAEPSPAPRVSGSRAIVESSEGVVVVGGSIERADVAALCERARGLVGAGHSDPLVCDVAGLGASLAAVDVLARIALTAGRLGLRVRVLNVPPAMRELLVLAGLDCVLPCEAASGLESRR